MISSQVAGRGSTHPPQRAYPGYITGLLDIYHTCEIECEVVVVCGAFTEESEVIEYIISICVIVFN